MRISSRPQSPVPHNATNTGGQYFDRRGEVAELKQALRAGLAERNQERMRENVKKVIMYMTLGIDMSRMFSEMVMASQLGDTVQKKMIYLYLTTYAEQNADLAILAVNTLQKDTKDVDPSVRGMALRSLCSLQIPHIIEYLEPAILGGLSDPNGYVRKTAVLGVLKHPSSSLVERVKHLLLSDHDASVISNCISVLSELSLLEPLVDRTTVYSLLNRFHMFGEWGKCTVLDNVVSLYDPSGEEELFDILNVLDPFLKQTCIPVCFGIVKLFLIWTSSDSSAQLNKQVLARLKDPMLTLLSSAATSVEMQHVILSQISTLIDSNIDFASLLAPHWKIFLLAHTDTVAVSEIKMSILASMKKSEVIEELKNYMQKETLVEFSVTCLVKLVFLLPNEKSAVVKLLMETCEDARSQKVACECLVGLKIIISKSHPQETEGMITDAFLEYVASACIKSADQRALEAIVNLISETKNSLMSGPYLLEDICDFCFNDPNATVSLKQAVVFCTINLFICRPLETRKTLLKRVLYMGIEDTSNPQLRDSALLYFRMLKYVGPERMKQIFAVSLDDHPNVRVPDYTSFNRVCV